MSFARGFLEMYSNMDVLLIIAVRMIGFIVILPILTGVNAPTIPKIGLAFFLAIVIMSTGIVDNVTYKPNIPGYFALIIKEFVVGFILAFTVNIIFTVFYFVGQMVDYQIGYSMVNVLDPVTQVQVPITGNLFYLLISVLFVVSGGLNDLIYSIAKSYEILPVGEAYIIGNASIMRYSLNLIVDYIVVGVKISMPIVGTILIVDIALGLLTKAVPQMNVFVVGLPLKLLVGLVVLILIIPKFLDVYYTVYKDVLNYIYNMLRGMAP